MGPGLEVGRVGEGRHVDDRVEPGAGVLHHLDVGVPHATAFAGVVLGRR